jgi:hypothetical protein
VLWRFGRVYFFPRPTNITVNAPLTSKEKTQQTSTTAAQSYLIYNIRCELSILS